MSPLQAVVSFWRDCIKSENALEQNFSLTGNTFKLFTRTQAVLFNGSFDPFIFSGQGSEYLVRPEDPPYKMLQRALLKDHEILFGYPSLMFYDSREKRHQIAPLFVLRLDAMAVEQGIRLTQSESSPLLGGSACARLGLQSEEIVALNAELTDIFEQNKSNTLETILYLLRKETKLTLVESIDPKHLSRDTTLRPYTGTVVYNKAILYENETTAFNFHLLHDLETLAMRDDLADTALDYLIHEPIDVYSDLTPVLPFAFDECQLKAIQHIVGSRHTVVTGPPGTGKSQFIANLIINLFLQKKRVLFVSHTSEAVRVVNERVNAQFANLIMVTGKKEIRQDLGRRLEAIVARYNQQDNEQVIPITKQDITDNWSSIKRDAAYIRETDALDIDLARIARTRQLLTESSGVIARIQIAFLGIQQWLVSHRLTGRVTSHDMLEKIEDLKTRHVSLSRSYVQHTYLSHILEQGHYGPLLAYIDAVQNRKFATGDHYDKSEKYIDAALQAMNIWSCTLKSLSATFPLRPNLFDYVIFDEASQIDMPSAAPALYRANRAVVVGDENQLTHIARINPRLEDNLAARYNLEDSPLYPAQSRYSDVSLFKSAKSVLREPEQELTNHYRSNAIIADLFSTVFYDGRLTIYEPDSALPPTIAAGVFWADVAGVTHKHKSGSKYNNNEVAAIVTILKRLLPTAVARHLTIGIATPYTRQRDILSDTLIREFDDEQLQHLKVLTVHKFQGSEVDILLFSTVLAGKGEGNSDYWYSANPQLLNVAISRAREVLIIIGDLHFAQESSSALRAIANYYEQMRQGIARDIPKRPMNLFEKQLLSLLTSITPPTYRIEPQYVVGGRYSVDIAVLGKQNIAIELDGSQHEIIAGLPVFADKARDAYLQKHNWQVVRIPLNTLINRQDQVAEQLRELFGSNLENQ